MRIAWLTVTTVCVVLLSACGRAPTGPTSKEALRDELVAAHEAQDVERLKRLFCWDGVAAKSVEEVMKTRVTPFLTQPMPSLEFRSLADIDMEPNSRMPRQVEGVDYVLNVPATECLAMKEGTGMMASSRLWLIGSKDGVYCFPLHVPGS